MNKSKKFSRELRERAVRMVLEQRGEYPTLWAAVTSMAPKIGCVPQTLLSWVQRHEIDTCRAIAVKSRRSASARSCRSTTPTHPGHTGWWPWAQPPAAWMRREIPPRAATVSVLPMTRAIG